MRLSLQTKMAVSFSMGLLILLTVGVTAWRANSKRIENGAWVAHSHQVLSHTESLLSALTEAESSARGYVVSGAPEFIASFQKIREEADPETFAADITTYFTNKPGEMKNDTCAGSR